MSTTRILTLFGEEIVNEPAKPAAKGRVRSKDALVQEGDDSENEYTISENPVENNDTFTTPVIVKENTLFYAVVDGSTETSQTDTLIDALHGNDAEQTSEFNTTIDKEAEEIYSDVLPDGNNSTDEDYNNSTIDDSEASTTIAEYEIVIAQYENQVLLSSTESETDSESPLADVITEQVSKPIKPAKKEKNTPEDIIPEDWSGEKKYYTIGEVADFFKVKTSHIRFWTNEFKLKVRTTRKGDRLFTPEQVKELRAIYHLTKERGFTISGAKAKLKTKNNMDVTTVDLKTSLLLLKTKLIALRKQLG
jgi:DNA-binding transcriptional MerR regulator